MKKLRQKQVDNFNLIDYQYFLKNNNLKQNKSKLKQNLFQSSIFLKNKNLINIEISKYENYFLPLKNKQKKVIYTIQTQYNNNFLFNYNFNYNLLYYFTKLFLNKKKINYKKKINKIEKINKIKGRIVNNKIKGVSISVFGLVFLMKLKNLHKSRRIFYKKKKKLRIKIAYYMCKYLNFKIEKKLKNKNILSRKTYVEEIIKRKKKYIYASI